MGKAMLFRPTSFRARLLELMKTEFKLTGGNTSQICRVTHGAKSRYDIKFCRNKKEGWRPEKGFTDRGNNALYEKCRYCSPGYHKVRYYLYYLAGMFPGEEPNGKQVFLTTRMEYRTDPIVPGAKDLMRMWYLMGEMPSLDTFIELSCFFVLITRYLLITIVISSIW